MDYYDYSDIYPEMIKVDCPCCAGTGEGNADGTRCICCNGRGYTYELKEENDQE
jgi:RecJ-like exonuclease